MMAPEMVPEAGEPQGWGRYDGMAAEYSEGTRRPDGIGWFPVSWVYRQVGEDMASLRERLEGIETAVQRYTGTSDTDEETIDGIVGHLRAWRERAEAAEARLAKLDTPHVLVLSPDRWTIEHSLDCRESGHMAECPVHVRVVDWLAEVGEPDLAKGRYVIGDGELPAALEFTP